MISKELMDEVIALSKENKMIDKKLVQKIVTYVVSKLDYKTKNNFRGVVFTTNKKFLGYTIPKHGIIIFDLESFGMELEEIDEIDENATMLDKNLYLVGIILHEIEHLKEPNVPSKSFESKLIKISNSKLDPEKTKIRGNTYYTNPSEKLAFAKSIRNLLTILNNYPNFKEEYFDSYVFINNLYIENLKLGYEKQWGGGYNTPLFDFLIDIAQLSHLKSLKIKLVKKGEYKKIDRCSLERKFMYGLPIKEEDMEELDKKKILVKQ